MHCLEREQLSPVLGTGETSEFLWESELMGKGKTQNVTRVPMQRPIGHSP